MYQWFAQSLGNVSVNRKLGLGFGLVLLLTLAITLAGWHGMDSIINRGDKLGNISVIQQYTQELRIARQHYQRQPDEASVAELEKALGNLERQVQLMLGQIEQPADRQRLEQQREAVRGYQQAFNELKQAGQRREASRAVLGDTADKAAELIGRVQRGLLQGGDISQYQHAVEVSALLQQARFQVRGYTYSGNADYQQTALKAIDQALAELRALPAKVPAEHAASLDDATTALAGYRDAVTQFGNAQAASEQALQSMVEHGTVLLQTSQAMTTSQTAVRDAGAAQAKTVLAVATVLALTLGLLAAWAITRQIIVPLRQTLHAAERVASGDLTLNLQVQRRDELGQLQALGHALHARLQLAQFVTAVYLQVLGQVATGYPLGGAQGLAQGDDDLPGNCPCRQQAEGQGQPGGHGEQGLGLGGPGVTHGGLRSGHRLAGL